MTTPGPRSGASVSTSASTPNHAPTSTARATGTASHPFCLISTQFTSLYREGKVRERFLIYRRRRRRPTTTIEPGGSTASGASRGGTADREVAKVAGARWARSNRPPSAAIRSRATARRSEERRGGKEGAARAAPE